jgi:hypothetical protein
VNEKEPILSMQMSAIGESVRLPNALDAYQRAQYTP